MSVKMRHKARECALQALYQWQFTKDSPLDIELQFHENYDFKKIDSAYFSELLHGCVRQADQINKNIEEVAGRSLTEVNPVELSVLRLAIYELLNRSDIPYRVIINEALQITKKFGATEGFKFVNGVLDKLAKKLRPLETSLIKKENPLS